MSKDKLSNTSPLVIGSGIHKEVLKRQFLGEVETWNIKDKGQRRYHTKMLRAYLKGWSRFGKPIIHPVLKTEYCPLEVEQEYYYVPANELNAVR